MDGEASTRARVAIREAHDAAVARGDAGYADPATGFSVFTTAALLARGRCCGNGCRHCPYGRVASETTAR
jgi:ATP-binding cassette subfamily B (MDR/TAP) protein 1